MYYNEKQYYRLPGNKGKPEDVPGILRQTNKQTKQKNSKRS